MYRLIAAAAACFIMSMPSFAASKLDDNQLARIAGGAHFAGLSFQSNSATIFQNTKSTSTAACVNCIQAVAISSASNVATTTQINLVH
jgi:hypothetical protein